jgi:hypothetical protein
MTMRLAATAIFLFLGAAAYAQDYSSSEYCDPWCSLSYARDCTYRTFEQCLVSIRGTSLSCYQNPFLYQCRRQSAANRTARRPR